MSQTVICSEHFLLFILHVAEAECRETRTGRILSFWSIKYRTERLAEITKGLYT